MILHQAGHIQETYTSPSGNPPAFANYEYRKEYLFVGLVGKGCQKGAFLFQFGVFGSQMEPSSDWNIYLQ